jgi:hypothetical protein
MTQCLPPPPCPPLAANINVQVFTATGTYLASPGLVSLTVECIGGGGGGGAADNWNTGGTWALGGGGGGSGGYSRKTLPAALVAGGVVVTIGPGGASQTNGGDTSFGALCVAHGGGQGWGNDNVTGWGAAGVGAAAGVGDIAFPGASGFTGPGFASAAGEIREIQGGAGGSIVGGTANYSSGNAESNPGSPGAAGTGAGGQGAIINQITGTSPVQPGGAGGSGICIITEFCWAGAGAAPSGMVNVPQSAYYREFAGG